MNILKLNAISPKANEVFDADYTLTTDCANPDGILLRSFNMADYQVGDKLVAVGRAGAGVNNIPFADYIKKGVVVFNTPGANANAVKELVVTSLLLSCRDIFGGISWAESLKGNGDDVKTLVEKGKSKFVGIEILGKTIGIIGLGAIGAMVAEAAIGLGMKVVGYDAFLNPKVAEQLKGRATIVDSLDKLYAAADFITIHVPYMPATKYMINEDAISKMKDGVAVINLARGELVENNAIKAAVASGKVRRYVVDFPVEELLGVDGIITVPHLGASTEEAEDNCAVMASQEIKDYIENGNIKNSVNFPALSAARADKVRVTVLAENSEVIAKATEIANGALKVSAMATATGKASAYMIIDCDDAKDAKAKLEALNGVYKVRVI